MNELSGALYVGVVDTIKPDPDGCLDVRIPALNGTFACRVATPLAGENRGMFFLPELHDQVLLGCVTGSDVEFVLLGSLLSGKAAMPEREGVDNNDTKLIRTRGGNEIRLVDVDGGERIDIATNAQSISLSIRDEAVTITATTIVLKGNVTVSGKLTVGGGATTVIEGNKITGKE